MKEPPKFSFETTFSPEQELENLLETYKDSHSKLFIDEKERTENENTKKITELSLYHFNIGLLMGMRLKNERRTF